MKRISRIIAFMLAAVLVAVEAGMLLVPLPQAVSRDSAIISANAIDNTFFKTFSSLFLIFCIYSYAFLSNESVNALIF